MADLILFTEKPALELFTEQGADALIAEVKERLVEIPTDISTEENREKITKFAFAVGKVKNKVDKLRLELVSGEKTKLKAIDSEGKKIWDYLEVLQKQISKPVDDFKAIEKNRIQVSEDKITAIGNYQSYTSEDAAVIEGYIVSVNNLFSHDWKEFIDRAAETKDRVLLYLNGRLEKAISDKAAAEELEKLRKEKTDREQKERENRLQQEAAEKAKQEAEDKAKLDQERLVRQKEEAERKQKEAETAKIKAEQDAKIAAEKAEDDRIAAAKKAEQDKIKAIEEAARKERERITTEEAAKATLDKKRMGDEKHHEDIQSAIITALLQNIDFDADGDERGLCCNIINVIDAGLIPNLKINY